MDISEVIEAYKIVAEYAAEKATVLPSCDYITSDAAYMSHVILVSQGDQRHWCRYRWNALELLPKKYRDRVNYSDGDPNAAFDEARSEWYDIENRARAAMTKLVEAENVAKTIDDLPEWLRTIPAPEIKIILDLSKKLYDQKKYYEKMEWERQREREQNFADYKAMIAAEDERVRYHYGQDYVIHKYRGRDLPRFSIMRNGRPISFDEYMHILRQAKEEEYDRRYYGSSKSGRGKFDRERYEAKQDRVEPAALHPILKERGRNY